MALKIKMFDEKHEKDLEEEINDFLDGIDEDDLVDIRYQVTSLYDHADMDDRQIYCFSAMVIYKK